MTMGLFTFVLDYRGGTYLFQVQGKNYDDAALVWANDGNFTNVAKTGSNFQAELLMLIKEEKPVEIEGLVNTWCLTFTIADELALIHFTKTAD